MEVAHRQKHVKKDLIEKAGISPTTVATMSKGRPVSLETLGKYANYLVAISAILSKWLSIKK